MKDLCVDSKKMKNNRIVDWKPPAFDNLKFNVYGSVVGKPGPAGVGGVLRDFNGKILCLFSYHMGILNSNVAELWAIKIAMDLCLSNPMITGRSISIVSDSKVAVSWVNEGDFGSLDHYNIINDIRINMRSFGDVEVVHESRVFNSFADSLAKMGSSQSGDFVEWGDL
ncbi:hypothetical protein Dsin_000142 [Dipteronia sinensis]|uniref:RNase H type-1 domain-containing protein n=1 Tax=Dipteronia sinensis TaxID=43782 RepID=A0AAD9Z486_9ROSI|nr:hypothetical protein Dsin_000142 [Dipteronia sinensis]